MVNVVAIGVGLDSRDVSKYLSGPHWIFFSQFANSLPLASSLIALSYVKFEARSLGVSSTSPASASHARSLRGTLEQPSSSYICSQTPTT